MAVAQKRRRDLRIEHVGGLRLEELPQNQQIRRTRMHDFDDIRIGNHRRQCGQIEAKRIDGAFDNAALFIIEGRQNLHQTKARIIAFFAEKFGVKGERRAAIGGVGEIGD